VRLLVVNPNTSVAVTEVLRERVAAIAGRGVEVLAATAPFGARYIADETSYAVAGHASLVAYAEHCAAHGAPDAVLLGCFGDPGVAALRELSGRPVVGLAEAAMREAARRGRFSIVTGGTAWDPMLRRLARTLGFDAALAGVHVVAPTGAQLAADPALAIDVLTAACRRAAVGVDAVIIGGAALAGFADAIQASSAIPVALIDSVSAGARAALVRNPEFAPVTRPATQVEDWTGVAPALQHWPRTIAAAHDPDASDAGPRQDST
jgi:allantoin racemase